jgi:flavodoxin, short chain
MIKIVYWSGTGNTEVMAGAVAKGVEAAGAEAKLIEVSTMTANDLKGDTVYALGCPSMGDEVLEEDLMEPFVEALLPQISGKKIGLFGSYGWGNCEWMRDWEERLQNAGASIVLGEGVTCMDAPDEEATKKCETLGKALTVE